MKLEDRTKCPLCKRGKLSYYEGTWNCNVCIRGSFTAKKGIKYE